MPHPAVNSSMSNNTREKRGREEKEGKREGREREGRGEGVGDTNHVTSLLLTSPRAATKRGMLSYLLYRALASSGAPPDQRVHPPTHTHGAEGRAASAPRLRHSHTRLPEPPGTHQASVKRSRSAWCAAGACVAAAKRGALSLSDSDTHAQPSLSHTRS